MVVNNDMGVSANVISGDLVALASLLNFKKPFGKVGQPVILQALSY